MNIFLRASLRQPRTCELSKNGVKDYCDKIISATVVLSQVANLFVGLYRGITVLLSSNTSLNSSSNLTLTN